MLDNALATCCATEIGARANQLLSLIKEERMGEFKAAKAWSHQGYDQRDVTNALKQFLIDGQFVKFFFLIDQPNASKHL